jgi:hypothetical protein
LVSLGWLNRKLILKREAQTYDLRSESPVSSAARPATEMKLDAKGLQSGIHQSQISAEKVPRRRTFSIMPIKQLCEGRKVHRICFDTAHFSLAKGPGQMP